MSLNVPGARRVHELLNEHDDIFTITLDAIRLAPSKVKIRHSFSLTKDNPIFERDRRLSPVHNRIEREEVNRLLDAGIISPSHSAWAFPDVIMTKKDRRQKLCVDYR